MVIPAQPGTWLWEYSDHRPHGSSIIPVVAWRVPLDGRAWRIGDWEQPAAMTPIGGFPIYEPRPGVPGSYTIENVDFYFNVTHEEALELAFREWEKVKMARREAQG